MKTKIKSCRWRALLGVAIACCFGGTGSFAQVPAASTASPVSSSPTQATTTQSTLSPAAPTPPSVAKPAMLTGDIRDIRGPIHLPPPVRWPWWVAGAVALAGLTYGTWYWQRRRTQAAALLPFQLALARLEKARALMQPENAREFSIFVSEVVRQFIEVRFQIRAARRTTEEFLRDLLDPGDALLEHHRESLADFLRHCDLAKFARWVLSTEEMTTMLQSAQNFVLQSGPTPPPVPVPPPEKAKQPPTTQPVVTTHA